MGEPSHFHQVHADGWSSGPHPWSAKSPSIIQRNLSRTDWGSAEAIVRIRVTHADGSVATYRRRVPSLMAAAQKVGG